MSISQGPLRIALIADDLAGHVRQAEAIVAAIDEVVPIELTRLAVRKWSPLRSHHLRPAVLAIGGDALVPLVISGDWNRPFDLVVSAAGSTATGSVLLKRRNRAANVFSGWVRGIRPGDIDCVLTHYPQHAGRPDHVFGPLPVLRFRSVDDRRSLIRLGGAEIGVLLGGEARGAGFDFGEGYCRILFERLRSVAWAVPDIRWVVVTSRRTPEAEYPEIEAFSQAVQHCEIVDYRTAGLGSIARAHSCDALLITEDSKTMITEFVRNGFPVAVLRVPRVGRRLQHTYFDALKASHNLPFVQPGEIEATGLETALTGVVIRHDDIYAETRALISRRLPNLLPARVPDIRVSADAMSV